MHYVAFFVFSVSREYGNTLSRVYIGLIFPYPY